MKRRYAYLLSGVLLAGTTMFSCSSENTTGVDTETTENEVDGRINDEDDGDITNENISPLDTSSATPTDTTHTGMDH